MEIEMMTVPEVADTIRIAPVTVRKWIRERRLAHQKFGGRVLIRRDDVVDFIEKNYHAATGGGGK
ncbi:MAG: helix-turn-helix domain-containing protein [Deltaproteobacteria bacterium]|nr:helix-turn-helix domain-containing protein [Deltaproteobacteria bacterium]